MPKKNTTTQSKGGKARAEKLSKARRSEIAKKAAAARWDAEKPVEATHDGILLLGDIELPCANLPGERRVVNEVAMLNALGRGYSGYYSRRDAASREMGHAVMPRYLSPAVLKPFIPEEIADLKLTPYVTPMSSNIAKGLDATLIPAICDVWLDARRAGKLTNAAQENTAQLAEIIVRSLARVGIIALIDEATGYQYERQREALQDMLQALLSDQLRRWVRTFPPSYFRELCRLKGVTYRPDMKLPQYFGHHTNDIVYKRLHPQVLEELKKLNPRVNGRRKQKNHQWLSEDVGHPALLSHLGAVVMAMKLSKTFEDFKQKLDATMPIYKDLPLFADQILNED